MITLLMYVWFIVYLVLILLGLYKMMKGKSLSFRDMGFLLMGFGFSFIPFLWFVNQHL